MLFAIGAVGALTRRNGISHLPVDRADAQRGQPDAGRPTRASADDHTGQLIVFFVMAVAAAEAAVGLALFIAIFRQRRTIDVNRLNLMRW